MLHTEHLVSGRKNSHNWLLGGRMRYNTKRHHLTTCISSFFCHISWVYFLVRRSSLTQRCEIPIKMLSAPWAGITDVLMQRHFGHRNTHLPMTSTDVTQARQQSSLIVYTYSHPSSSLWCTQCVNTMTVIVAHISCLPAHETHSIEVLYVMVWFTVKQYLRFSPATHMPQYAQPPTVVESNKTYCRKHQWHKMEQNRAKTRFTSPQHFSAYFLSATLRCRACDTILKETVEKILHNNVYQIHQYGR